MLFISKEVSYQPLQDFLNKKQIPLIDKPLIGFEAQHFKCPHTKEYEVVFFSSPRSVEFFFEKCELEEGVLVGSIGTSTSRKLKERSVNVDFEGDQSGKPDTVSAAFAQFVGGKKVLFPQSDRSNRSMQRVLPSNQVVDLITYTTELQPTGLEVKPDILVFTSPSNAESFLLKNSISENQKVIAWGKTTELFLLKRKIKAWKTLVHSSFEELTRILQDNLN